MATRAKAITIKIKLTGAKSTIAALRDLPKEASKEIRVMSGKLADRMVGWIVANANAAGSQSALLAPTVRRLSDRLPTVQVGGNKILHPATHRGKTQVRAYQVLFGANFGATRHWQFTRAHRGRGETDYFVWVSIEGHQAEIDREFSDGADRIIKRWTTAGSDE